MLQFFHMNIFKFTCFYCHPCLQITVQTFTSSNYKIVHSATLGVAIVTETTNFLSSCFRARLLPRWKTEQLKQISCSYFAIKKSLSRFPLILNWDVCFNISVFVLVTWINYHNGTLIWEYTIYYTWLSMINCVALHLCLSESQEKSQNVCVCMYPVSNLGSWPLQTLCCSPPVSLEVWCSLSQCRASSGASAAAAEPAPAQVQDLAEDNTLR